MARVLVTGVRGILGSEVVRAAASAGHEVVPASRTARPGWAAFDASDPGSYGHAFDGVDVVVHCAAAPFKDAMAAEPGALASMTRAAPDVRFVYPSIVGVDRIRFSYYRVKVAGEQALANAGVDHAILRITQFHELADRFAAMPVAVVPRHFRSQPIAAREAAGQLVALIDDGTKGRAPDVGGPEVLQFADMVRQRRRALGRRVPTLSVPMGAWSRDLKMGHQLCPDRAIGTTTWAQHLAATSG